ncbi:hypothetical protein GQ44DRAFT_717143 [Phaeosphaeriaceae sp. PMI808]|nr:hypothetical protein GQ44DRAFT_717143 [Phaeosphaeriaceae sp. PMI808]
MLVRPENLGFEVHQPHAEVLFQEINKRTGDGGDSTYSIIFYHDTIISRCGGPHSVRMNGVLVMSEQKANPSKPTTVQQIKCDAADVEFGDSNDAQTLLSSLHSMQSHLFHLYLTRPLFGEHILFLRFVGDMAVRDNLLPSATISLVYSPETDAYRVILLADTRAASVCMPLSPRQLEGLMTDQNAGTQQYPAYFLVRDMNGIEVVSGSVRLDELVPSGTGARLYPLLSTERVEGQGGGGG